MKRNIQSYASVADSRKHQFSDSGLMSNSSSISMQTFVNFCKQMYKKFRNEPLREFFTSETVNITLFLN